MSDAEGANGKGPFEEAAVEGLSMVSTPRSVRGDDPLQKPRDLGIDRRRAGDPTHAEPLLRAPIAPIASREALEDTNVGDSRRWVLAGLRAYERPGEPGCLLSTASRPPLQEGRPVPPWSSFSPTAAGQPRLLNRVPIFSLYVCTGTNTGTAILGCEWLVNTICWGPVPNFAKAAEGFRESSVHWSPGQYLLFEQYSKRACERRGGPPCRAVALSAVGGHAPRTRRRQRARGFPAPKTPEETHVFARFAEEIHDRRRR